MAKEKGSWIQAARKKMRKKGTEGSYGHHTEKQMERDKAKGGAIGKKANFALNMAKMRKKGRKRGRRR